MTTTPERDAKRIKEDVLKKKLAGCVLEFSSKSMFLWKGKIEEENEVLLIFKTTKQVSSKLKQFLKQIHPYEMPFIASVDVEANKEYLAWLEEINKN